MSHPDKPVIEYTIATAKSVEDLASEMNNAGHNGYEPEGNVFTFTRDGVLWFGQRMQHESTLNHCPEDWKLDVNDRYQMAVGTITSLSTASFVLPIIFLKEVVNIQGKTIAQALSAWVYAGWTALAVSVCSAIVYYFCSAKWVKLAWRKNADIFGINVTKGVVEILLDLSYFFMMTGFVGGFFCVIKFMVDYSQ